jgi:hypothetical protein
MHFNHHRPHRALHQATPLRPPPRHRPTYASNAETDSVD